MLRDPPSATSRLRYLSSPAYQITLDDISNTAIARDRVPYSVSSGNRNVYVTVHEGSRYL
jgi:hypothetical protein